MTDAEQIDDGGCAFPPSMAVSPSGDVHWSSQIGADTQGLSVRDYFAGQALVEFSGIVSLDVTETFNIVARYSYRMADAMIAARRLAPLESDPKTLRGYCQQLLDLIQNYDVQIEGEDNDLIAHISKQVDPAHSEAEGR